MVAVLVVINQTTAAVLITMEQPHSQARKRQVSHMVKDKSRRALKALLSVGTVKLVNGCHKLVMITKVV